MTEEDSTLAPASEGPDAPTTPTKKKTSVKVVRRVKSKKSEKGERPELAPPPPTIDETTGAAANDTNSSSPKATIEHKEVESSIPPKRETPIVQVQPEVVASQRRVSSKKRAQRSGSNVFAMFTQNQVHQFKEAFSFIDQDKDGIISKHDIRASFDALGRLCNDKELEEMTSEAPGPINFTMFLTVFGDRVQGTDDEDVVLNAFSRYDEGDGFCKEEKWVYKHILIANIWYIHHLQQNVLLPPRLFCFCFYCGV